MKLLTLARDLRRRKARERQHLFVCEGVRTVEEILRSTLRPIGALVAPQLAETPRGSGLIGMLRAAGILVEEVGAREFASATQTESPQGVLAIADVPDRRLSLLDVRESLRLLILDGIQDPGNVGTIVRTAAALGADATLAMPGTVDLWNAKVVRSAMGALFDHFSMSCTWDELDSFRAGRQIAVWSADASGRAIGDSPPPARVALVVGNEGNGLSSDARGRSDQFIAIPIVSAVESLNVAVAAGILLYQLRR